MRTNLARALAAMRRHLVLCITAVAAGACGAGQPSAGVDDAPPATATDSPAADAELPGTAGAADAPDLDPESVPLTCEGLHEQILKVPPTRQAFANEFGPPDSVAATTEPNRHVPGAVDSLFTVYYPGLVLDLRTPTGARDMATHVRLEQDRYLAYPAFGMGTPAGTVEAVLGEPHSRDSGNLKYQCGMGAEQPVTFMIDNGRVTAIEIAFYVD